VPDLATEPAVGTGTALAQCSILSD